MILAGEQGGGNLLHCKFFDYEFQTDWHGIKTGTPW